ncbi:MAG: tetratricopeptide repeat protein [Alphaproteobacteria bacterium]
MSKKRILIALATVGIAALLSTQAFAGFLEGKKAYDKADWMTAIMNLRPLAEAGDARAAVLLGNMYLDGHGVKEDAVEAAGLYHKAALANNTDAMVALAVLYQKGRGLDVNIPVSRGWYERAARLGNQPAAFIYALHLFGGSKGLRFDFKPDPAGAYKWLKIVSQHGPDKKLAATSGNMADQIVAQKLITNDEMVAADRDVENWKAEMPESFTKTPEDIRLEELREMIAKEQAEQKLTDPLPELGKLPVETAEPKKKKSSDKPKGPPPGGHAVTEKPAQDGPPEDATPPVKTP